MKAHLPHQGKHLKMKLLFKICLYQLKRELQQHFDNNSLASFNQL